METIYNNEDVIQGRRRLLRKKFEPKIFYTNHLFSPLHHNSNTKEKKLDQIFIDLAFVLQMHQA